MYRRILILGLAAVLLIGTNAFADLTTISGEQSLANGGMQSFGEKWGSGPMSISWLIEGTNYHYDGKTPSRGGVSWWGIEMSPDVTLSDISNFTASNPFTLEVGEFGSQGSSVLGMPESAYMLKIEFGGEVVNDWWVDFDINRTAVPGDVFLKDGIGNYAYNTGFTFNDLDTGCFQIMRPDTEPVDPNPVPAPGAIVLGAIGILTVGAKRRQLLM